MGDCDHDGEGACGDEAAEPGSEDPLLPGPLAGRGESLDATEAGEGAACEGAHDASAPGKGKTAVGGEGDGDGPEAAACG